jgi:hypothetical protein
MFRALVEKANKHNNKQWIQKLSDLQINKLDTPVLKHRNPYCSQKNNMHVNDNSQQLEIHELFDVQVEIDSLYNNMKNLISNSKNIDSPISLKLS